MVQSPSYRGGPSDGPREDMWPRGDLHGGPGKPDNQWRSDNVWQPTPQHHPHASQHHHPQPRMMMGPRYNDSWHHKPRFQGKKEFYPRHSFSGPRGMMHQGPRSLHHAGGPPQAQQQPLQPHHPVTTNITLSHVTTELVKDVAVTTPATVNVAPIVSVATKIEDVGTPTEDEKKGTNSREGADDLLVDGDNLSEFSDDGDEILLDKIQEAGQMAQTEEALESDQKEGAIAEGKKCDIDAMEENDKDDDLTLDFEEISDGELEEESARVKGLGDALGVDWAGLVGAAEPREVRGTEEQKATVKEMWEPKRIFKDVGISVRMAGRELAGRLLATLQVEHGKRIKVEKLEPSDTENVVKEEVVTYKNDSERPEEEDELNVDLEQYPVASCQVTLRRGFAWRSKLIMDRGLSFGRRVNPVALCARKDLQLRRQLCGLPAGEICLGSRADPQQQNELRMRAMELFAKATAVN